MAVWYKNVELVNDILALPSIDLNPKDNVNIYL